ncbi:MAG TPA: peptidylprolyl isomerase [Blastocatellia bacterium]|nr:peptidylprolyl isomerase [Blastocatellia bacterium]
MNFDPPTAPEVATKSSPGLWVIAGLLPLMIIVGGGAVSKWKSVQSKGSLPIPSPAQSTSLSAADLAILLPEIIPPEGLAQYSDPFQKKELAKQIRHFLAIAQIAEREGYGERPDVRTQMEFISDHRLARSYATRHPDKTVSDKEIKAYVASHAAEIDAYRAAYQRLKGQIDSAQLDSFKETYARIKLMAAKARESGAIDKKTADILSFWGSREVLYQTYVDDMIAKYYEEHKNEYEQVRVRHILVSIVTQEEGVKGKRPRSKIEARRRAEALLARARKGEDFAKLAVQYSDDGSSAQGGDLGYFSRGVMVVDFEEVAFALKPGQVSELVQTPYGFHIMRLEGRRIAPVDDPMTQQQIQTELQPKLDRLVEASDMKVAEDFVFTPKPLPRAQKKRPGKE